MRDRAPICLPLPPFLLMRAADLSRLPLVLVQAVVVVVAEWLRRVSVQAVVVVVAEWLRRVSVQAVAVVVAEWLQRVSVQAMAVE